MRGYQMGIKRKNFTVSLDPDETAYVQEQLNKQGMTLSGFIRAAISEFKESLVVMEHKDLKNMTVTEFIQAVEHFSSKMKDESEEKDLEIEKKLKA